MGYSKCRLAVYGALSLCLLCLNRNLALCYDQVRILPEFAAGDGSVSNLYLSNQGTTSATVQVSLFADDGSPLAVQTNMGTNSVFSIILYPGESELLGSTSTGSPTAGYAVLTYSESAKVSCSEVFRYEQNGSVLYELGVQPQVAAQHFSFPAVVATSNKLRTGLAVANYNDQPQTVIINLIESDGNVLGNWLMELPARGHRAQYLDELVPGLDNFSGAVSVSAPNPIGVLAIRQGSMPTSFTFAGAFGQSAASGTLDIARTDNCAGHVLTTWSALRF